MSSAEPLKTTLYDWHKGHGGRLVEFGGWSMPVQYSTIVEEHQAVRNRVGLFDIGHMGRLQFTGPDALAWLEKATTNQVGKLAVDQIQYSLTLTEQGGVIDDLLVYRRPEDYGVVCNASNRSAVLGQFERLRGDLDARLVDWTERSGMIAVQGPKAQETLQKLIDVPLNPIRYYYTALGSISGVEVLVSRTGYTGEDGFELIVAADRAEAIWTALLDAGSEFGIAPCGLGARDTLRFEAAMCLYGHELSESINPYAAGVGWAVKPNKGEFVGREAILGFKANPGSVRIGLELEGKRIARQGATVLREGTPVGTVTSGSFAPTLGRSLAMALVDTTASAAGGHLSVDVRGHIEPAKVVPLPFYKRAGH